MASLLDQLRGLSAVSCDTLDAEVAQKLGPFVHHTSNQAIALAELNRVGSDGKPLNEQLIVESIQTAHWMFGKQADATLEELAVELMTVGLSLRFAPYLTGSHFVQVNPNWSYSSHKITKNAERLVSHFQQLSPGFDARHVCIKVPSTWEGLQACRELEKKGIATLATTVFCIEQAALAAGVGSQYIAPYINELRVHFDPSYTDANKALGLCATAQRLYEARGSRNRTTPTPTPPIMTTQIMPASLTSIDEVMALAGVKHITVSPALLAQLAATPAAGWSGSGAVGQVLGMTFMPPPVADSDAVWDAVLRDESLWRMAFTRSDEGRSECKIVQAINIFCDMQDELERLVRRMDTAVIGARGG